VDFWPGAGADLAGLRSSALASQRAAASKSVDKWSESVRFGHCLLPLPKNKPKHSESKSEQTKANANQPKANPALRF